MQKIFDAVLTVISLNRVTTRDEAERIASNVSKALVKSFPSTAIEKVEDFLNTLSAEDLHTVVTGQGAEVSAVYKKFNTPYGVVGAVESVLDMIYGEV